MPNLETIPQSVRNMARNELEDEIVRLRRLFESVGFAVFVNGDLAIHKAEISVNPSERFIDIRTRG